MKNILIFISAFLILVSNIKAVDTVNVSWTAPGDDGNVGTATSYVLRYSTSPITALNFNDTLLHQTAVTPLPKIAGTIQNVSIIGLLDSTRYWFAIKAIDDAGNISLISNIVDTITSPAPDTTAPGTIQIILGWFGPNPFQESITIGYSLQEESYIRADVFNILGRKVDNIIDRMEDAGSKTLEWHPRFQHKFGFIFHSIKV